MGAAQAQNYLMAGMTQFALVSTCFHWNLQRASSWLIAHVGAVAHAHTRRRTSLGHFRQEWEQQLCRNQRARPVARRRIFGEGAGLGLGRQEVSGDSK